MRKKKGKGPLHIVKEGDAEERAELFRRRILEWLRQANFEPQEALGTLVSLAGMLAAGLKIGKGTFKGKCGEAYKAEARRLLGKKLEGEGY
jgi:hypothetical protein